MASGAPAYEAAPLDVLLASVPSLPRALLSLHRAVHRRFKINGVGIGMIDVMPADITAALNDYEGVPAR